MERKRPGVSELELKILDQGIDLLRELIATEEVAALVGEPSEKLREVVDAHAERVTDYYLELASSK